MLEDQKYALFTAESKTQEILGFVFGQLICAPEVYNPGGLTLMIDDFCVKCADFWDPVGTKLIDTIKSAVQRDNATQIRENPTQILVVCGAHDHIKRKFLIEKGLSIASEWFVGSI